MVEISLNEEWTKAFLPPFPEMKQWHQILLRGKSLHALYLAGPQEEIRDIVSLDQFLTLWLRDGFRPVLLPGSTDKFDSVLNARRNKTALIRQCLDRFAAYPLTNSVTAWLARLRADTFLVDNLYLDAKDLRRYLEPANNPNWQTLVFTDLEKEAALEAALEDLVQ